MSEHTDIDVHLATCPECAGDLARYREVVAAVGSLRDHLEDPPAGMVQRITARVVEPESRIAGRLRRVATDRRVHVAAASFGGAVLGAGAIAILWRRAARRAAVA